MAAVLVALALVIGLLIGMVGVGGVLLPPGLASAITGTGGPVILVPILLLLGVAPIVAIAVSQGVQLPVVLAGSVGYLQTGLVDVRLGTLLGLVAALGAVGGAMVAPRVPAAGLRPIMAVACLVAGVLLVVRVAG